MNLNHPKMSFHQKASISAAFAGLIVSTVSIMGQVPANWPASYPEWWYDADPAKSMIDVSSLDDPGNQSPILQGQLLHMADIGIQELDEQLGPVGGAGFTIDDFRDPDKMPSYYSPAAIGQLKYVVSKFYDRFAEVGYQPGSIGWNPNIVLDEGAGDNSPNYPWRDNQTPENLSIALIGQAKFLFSWDLTEWAESQNPFIDEDEDDLPDDFEQQIISADLNDALVTIEDVLPSDDFDGDGLSNLAEYEQGSDPTDYFSQGSVLIIPEINILSGNNQYGPPSSSLPKRLTVIVTDSATGNPLDNAPVTFSPNTGSVSRTMARTISDGRSAVTFRTPDTLGTSLIDATSGSASIQFTATTHAQGIQPPAAPSNFISITRPDGSRDLSWTDNSNNEDVFVITLTDSNGQLVELGTVPANQTTATINSDGTLAP